MKKSWLFLVCVVLYVAMHIYFAYYAFTAFKLWFALVVFLAPVIGDIMLCGAAIGLHNWLPAIWLCVVGALYFISDAVARKSEVNQ